MIALGSDQAGYNLKQEIIKYLEEKGLQYKDYGSFSEDPVDYPVYGENCLSLGYPYQPIFISCLPKRFGQSCAVRNAGYTSTG